MQRWFVKLGRHIHSTYPRSLPLFSSNPLPMQSISLIRSMNSSFFACPTICQSRLSPHPFFPFFPLSSSIPHCSIRPFAKLFNNMSLYELGFIYFEHVQVLHPRYFASESKRDKKKKKMKLSRAPKTPVISKLKKYKLKAYSSFKYRFRTLGNGQIRRGRAGKNHNAHEKSKKSKRRLRKLEVVYAPYAKVMKKLNFAG